MLATCLAALVVTLHAGDVIAIPPGARVVVPGMVNWILQEPAHEVPPGTRAIVVRVAPERQVDLVEVKLFDGTARLGWLVDSNLTSVRMALEDRRNRSLPDRPDAVKGYGIEVDPRLGRRNGHAPNFAAVDALIFGDLDAPPAHDLGPAGAGGGGGGDRPPAAGGRRCGKPDGSKPGSCQRLVRDGGACPLHGP